MKFAIDREELAKALCDRFPLGVPYTAYREDADAIIAALERAPQAQEEPSGAPVPAGMCPHCFHNMELVAKTVERIKYLEEVERKFEAHVCPQPPAPASPAGPRTHSAGVLECLGYAMSIIEMTASALKAPASEGGMPNSPLLPQLRHAYESLKAARDFPDLAPAAPEAGAPGTQGAT